METNLSARENFKAPATLRWYLPERFHLEVSPKLGLLYHASKKTNLRPELWPGIQAAERPTLSDPLIGDRNLKFQTSPGGDVGIEEFLLTAGRFLN